MNESALINELKYLEKCIADCEGQLKNLPDGKLIISHNGKRSKWYISTNGHKDGIRYLSKKDQKKTILAEKLAYKRYLECLLKESISQKEALVFYLDCIRAGEDRYERLISDVEFQKLLKWVHRPANEELKAWADEKYVSNAKYVEGLKYPSATGHVLRSKSEVIIDMALAMHQIPFRYEAGVTINGVVYYPDFTIRHPQTGEYYYWEHFGLVDQQDYLNNCLQKLRNYIKSGFIPMSNLITTYETNDHPLSPQIVDAMIRMYFL